MAKTVPFTKLRRLFGATRLCEPAPLKDQARLRLCCAGPDGAAALRKMCARVRVGLETAYLSSYDLGYVLKALFETHPLIALDEFLLAELRPRNRGLFEGDFGSGTPVEDVGAETLVQ